MKNGPRCPPEKLSVRSPARATGNHRDPATVNHARGRAENRSARMPSFLHAEVWRAFTRYFSRPKANGR